ncbi:MAG: restriction endonuclease subunit S [Christensenellaceae bacterium]|jgi:type I restriction enzyme S subunit|nr:restriction endonuclease subunit S [Christensenellaceae bacterium]
MMNSYPEYRASDLPWLGDIPSHWKVGRAKNMYRKEKRAVRLEDETVTCFRDGTVTLRKNRRITGFTESAKEIGYQGIRNGDLVIHVMDAFAGSIGVSDSDGKSTPVYSVCTAKGDYNNHFYALLLREVARTGYIQSLYRGIRERSTNFTFEIFAAQSLLLPPREEQDQIVRFLGWKIEEVNHFIHKKKQEIARLTELINVQIRNAVFGGLQSDVVTKDSEIRWVGEIPDHWNVRVLFELAAEQSVSNKTVHNQNLLSLSYGKIVNKDINTMDGLLPASYDTYQIANDGNVIMRLTDLQNDKRSLRVGIASQTGIITSAYTCLKARSDEILPHYLYLLLHSYDICKVFYSMGGGVRQSIGYGEIKRMALPLPPVEEQQAIVDYCYSLRTNIERLIAEVKKEIALITEYRTRMISNVVTGKVDVRDIEVPDLSAEDTIAEEADDAEIDNEASTDEIEEVEEDADD